MSETSNRKLISWIGMTLAVMFILPFAVAKLASECAGAWLFFDIHEPWFIAYAATYLCIGVFAMLITNYLRSK